MVFGWGDDGVCVYFAVWGWVVIYGGDGGCGAAAGAASGGAGGEIYAIAVASGVGVCRVLWGLVGGAAAGAGD